ncbi:MAG: YkgJ family cysteine cluster protein [Pseudomonadota bacterium]
MEDISLDTCMDNYRTLVARVDRLCREIVVRYGSAVVCRQGCDTCCRHLSLFPVEAVSIRLALDSLGQSEKTRIMDRAMAASEDACPLLDQGICLMYSHRPIICRTHGMPVLVDRDGERVVDFCPLNFKGIPLRDLDRQTIIDLETLNTALAVINRMFASQVLDKDSFPERLYLADALLMELD